MTSPTSTFASMPETSIEKLYAVFKQHPVICTDTRKLSNGCIFFALKGESFNGNLFAMQALKEGAAYAVVDEFQGNDDRLLQVSDVLLALQQLATYHRRQ